MNHAPRETLKVAAYGVYRSLHLDAMATPRGQAYVLNLHRVHPDPSPYWPPIHPYDLDWLIGRLRRLGTFASVEEVSSRRVPARARLFALSFDDGYDDFLSHALPVIASHGVPVNLNVVGSSLVSGQPIWNARLYDALGRNCAGVVRTIHQVLPELSRDVETLPPPAFGAKVVAHLRPKPPAQRLALLDRLEAEQGLTDRGLGIVTLQDVAGLPEFVHLGSHSHSHEPMGTVSMPDFLADFDTCRRLFAERLRRPLTTYAFPNGVYRGEQIEALLAHGIERVLLVDERPTSGGNPVIPRLTVGGTIRGQFLAKSTDASGALRRRGRCR